MSEDDLRTLARYCESVFDLGTALPETDFGYQSLPLCVIDAVYSIGVRYASTVNVVERYCECFGLQKVRTEPGLPPPDQQESVTYFLRKLERMGIERFAGEVFANWQRTSTRNGILKAEAVLRFAEVLCARSVDYFQDVPKVVSDDGFAEEIKSIPGQRSGVSLSYFFMLTGSDDLVKPDRWVLRFLRDALGREVAQSDALVLIQGACALLLARYPHLSPRSLDHAIWEYQSGLR